MHEKPVLERIKKRAFGSFFFANFRHEWAKIMDQNMNDSYYILSLSIQDIFDGPQIINKYLFIILKF